MRSSLIATALLALVVFGCNSGQPEEVMNMVASMENEIATLKSELVEVKSMVKELKSELSTCKIEMRALAQEKLQEAEAAAEGVLEEMPKFPENPMGEAE